MSGTTYYPNVKNPTAASASFAWTAILSSTNASPIAITTTLNGSSPGAHGLATGDCVEIVGHATNTTANGIWQVIVTSSTTFTLNGSTGTGVGGRTGNVHSCTVDPAFTLPIDTDLVTASSVNTFAEGNADAIPFLFLQAGKYRLVDQYYIDNNSTGVPWTNWGGTPGNTQIATATTAAGDYTHFQDISGDMFGGSFSGYTNPPGIVPGDVLDIQASSEILLQSTAPSFAIPTIALQVALGIKLAGGSLAALPGSNTTVPSQNNAGGSPTYTFPTYAATMVLRNQFHYSSLGFGVSSFEVHLMGAFLNIGGSSTIPYATKVTPTGVYSCVVNHYRAVGAEF